MFSAFLKKLFGQKQSAIIPSNGMVAFDDAGISFHPKVGPIFVLKWGEIDEIVTFKRDLVGYDTVCLVFVRENPKFTIEIDEEWTGFGKLVPELPGRYSGVAPDWYFKVMKPAFKANTTVLFKRSRGLTNQ